MAKIKLVTNKILNKSKQTSPVFIVFLDKVDFKACR